MTDALKQYHLEVKSRTFPAPQNTYPIDQQQLEKFYQLVDERGDERQDNREEQTVAAHAHA